MWELRDRTGPRIDVEAGLLMIAGGVAAGIFGSLLGLGGGILIVPMLTLGFGLPLRDAVGASLVAVIVTSGASAGVYLERHVANLRLGMTLELFTALGALAGGLVAFVLPERVLAGLFAALLAYTGASMFRARTRVAGSAAAPAAGPSSATAPSAGASSTAPSLATPTTAAPSSANPPSEVQSSVVHPSAAASSLPASTASAEPPSHASISAPGAVTDGIPQGDPAPRSDVIERLSGPGYRIRNVPAGVAGSLFAGVVSALLGVGGGIVKVPVMHLLMNVPLRVATATSNLMIGVTGSASAIVYLLRGGIDPYVAGPTALGVFVGASIGSRTAHRVDAQVLRVLFIVVMAYTAWEMLGRALG